MSASDYRTRFAPSPTGYLHAGHAFAAAQAFGAAEEAGGTCLLRIEDIDQTRCRPEFEQAIYEDLGWLGLDWPEPVRRQSEHFDDYAAALKKLTDLGLTYRCFLTRKEIARRLDAAEVAVSPAGERPFLRPEPILSAEEEAERIAAGEPFAWRLSLAACRDYLGNSFQTLEFKEDGADEAIENGVTQAHPEWLGDVVLARKDAPTSYHLAVCHDDAVQSITHVVRGADLYHATHIHVLLQTLMGWHTPIYHHHPLVLDNAEKKLAKTRNSRSIRDLRAAGARPEDILAGRVGS